MFLYLSFLFFSCLFFRKEKKGKMVEPNYARMIYEECLTKKDKRSRKKGIRNIKTIVSSYTC